MIKLPEKFTETMQTLLGDEYDAFIESYNRPVYSGVRVNTLKLAPQDYLALTGETLEAVPWNENGFYCESAKKYSRNPLYYAGLYYIQEPSAMLPAGLLPIEEGDRVLDMCAAPGGKSTALAAKLQGTGLLVSNDISYSRAKALLKNIEAFGVDNSLVISEDPKNMVGRFTEFFDKILIDAPCSGEGMFHKKPSMTESWERTGPEFYSEIQRAITGYGAQMLKPGGYMVFSTCTFSPLEDEGTIQYFLENHPEFELVKEIRLWPHKVKGEGHYVTLLHKKGERTKNFASGYTKKNKAKLDGFYAFLKDAAITKVFDESRIEVQKDHVYYMPKTMVDTNGLRVLRAGLYLGNLKKDRFEPSGSFAVALKKEDCRHIIDLDYRAAEAVKYLKCETLRWMKLLKTAGILSASTAIL